MAMDRLESHLKRVSKGLDMASHDEREAMIAELRDHILQATAQLESEGIEHEKAIDEAIQQMGDQRDTAAAISLSCSPSLLFLNRRVAAQLLFFVLAAAGLSVLLPQYATPIVLMALLSLISVIPGYAVGLSWDNAVWTPQSHGQVRLLLVTICLVCPLVRKMIDHLVFGLWVNWIKTLEGGAAMLAFTMIGFYLGRAVDKLRNRP
jgi:hypothetical protein